MDRMTYAVYGCDGAAGSRAHYSSPHGCTKTFNPQHKAGAQFIYPKEWQNESSSRARVLSLGVEPGPLASEASVLPLDHLLSVYPLEFHCYHVYKLRYTLFQNYFRLQSADFDFSLTPTNGSVYINPVVLLDIENIGIAFEISLPSHIQGEIYVISYPLLVIGRHLLNSHSPRHTAVSSRRRNFVAIMYIHAETYVIPHPLPVIGLHLWLIIHPDVGECSP